MDPAPTASASRAVPSLPFGFEGELVKGVAWGGTRFHAVVVLNEMEIQRRAAIGLAHVLDYQLLDALSDLPLDQAVPWGEVDPIKAAILDCAPPGVVHATHAHVTCRLAAPLKLAGVFLVADHWRALGRIGAFTRVTPCGVVVRHKPRALEQALGVARGGGLGLAVLEGKRPRALIEPAAQPTASTGRRRIVEAVFGQWRRQTTRMPANSHHALS